MRKQPKRAALIAKRNTIGLKKQGKVSISVSSIDRSLSSVARAAKLKERNRKVLRLDDNRGSLCKDSSSCVDTFVSDLTPSTSTLELHSSESETVASYGDEETELVEHEQPLVTTFQNRDIMQIISELKLDFKEADREEDQRMMYPFFEDLKSMFFDTSCYSKKDRELNTRMDIGNNFLRTGDTFKANVQYQEALELSKFCSDHALVAQMINIYGSFVSICDKDHRRATIILSEALSIDIPAPVRIINLCRAITYTTLGKVYVRRSLETGIKDEGMKNLKRADVCLSMALDIYVNYDKTQEIQSIVDLMNKSMDFRIGVKRTMWNEAIANEACFHDVDSQSSGSSSSSFILDGEYGDSCVFLNDKEEDSPGCVSDCYWGLCFAP